MPIWTTRHRATVCPRCRHILDASTWAPIDPDPDEPAPSPKRGDFTVCFNCGEILRYRRDLSVYTAGKWDLSDPGLPPARRLALVCMSEERRAAYVRRNMN